MIRVLFSCDGCDAESVGTSQLRREFVSVSGRSYGLGSFRPANSIEDVTPEGWIAYDPYTQCTYCQKCWSEIERSMDT